MQEKLENDQNTSFAKLPSAKLLFLYEFKSYIYNCSAFGFSYFFASFSPVRKSEIIERKFKTQNPNPSPSGSDSEPASPARNQIEAKRLRNKKGRVERNLSFAENDQV